MYKVFPFPLYILSAQQLECNWTDATPATSLVFSFTPQHFSACPFLDTLLLLSILKNFDKYYRDVNLCSNIYLMYIYLNLSGASE